MRSYFLNENSSFAKFILNSNFALKTKIELCNQNKNGNYFFMNKLVQSLQSNAKFQKKLLKLSYNSLSGSLDSSFTSISSNESTEDFQKVAKTKPKRARKSADSFWRKSSFLRLLDFNFFLLF